VDRSVLGDVHGYWFGDLKSPEDAVAPETRAKWFEPTVADDDYIRQTYGRFLDPALAFEWNLDELSRAEQVGLVVLLDQFPRHIFRESGQSYAYDRKVRAIAGQLVDGGFDRFYLPERLFLTLPYQHSEDVADQDLGVWLSALLVVATPIAGREGPRRGLDFAIKHRDLITKFGRFPHRNAMLGRPSTPEEEAFLKEHGRGF
jgi:uncharacterized protein (DUF924 family)